MRATGSSAWSRAVFFDHVDPALHRVDVGDGGEIQAAAPDEGADRLQEAVPERQVAGDRAGLDHGGTLPVLAQAFVVGQGGVERDGGRRRGRVGAQPQVGAEDVAVGVARLHQGDQVARQPGREGADAIGGSSARVDRRGPVIDQDEVDIGRVVQFGGTQLAHREGDETAVEVGTVGVLQADVAAVVGGAQQVADGQPQGRLGQIGQGAGDSFQWPDSADIRYRGDQGDGPLCPPQGGGDIRTFRGGGHMAERGQEMRARGVGAVRRQPDDRVGFAQRQRGEVGAVAAQAPQHGQDRRACPAGGPRPRRARGSARPAGRRRRSS